MSYGDSKNNIIITHFNTGCNEIAFQVLMLGICDDQSVMSSYLNNGSITYEWQGYFDDCFFSCSRDYMGFLNKAKELKHIADGETDRSMQAMKYLEAALYFILSGQAMESDHDSSVSLTMYKDTLNFIK